MAFSIKFNEEKNQLLKATRRVSFEDVLEALKKKKLLADIAHPSQKHSRQRLYVVKIKQYAYAVPYVIDTRKQEIFLKTIYPSRILTKIYLEGGKNEKKK
ncbi:MAG TPA: toxin [Patescibacteria group bacterium]|nr:toxin [Patescibacteria group bacterium]